MKKILYPTDFSDAAENAFIHALHIADQLGASMITLHAFDKPDISNINLPPVLRDVYDSIDLEVFENYEDEIPILREIAITNGYYHVPMVHVLEEGAPVSAILRTANRNKVDLIVMGATGGGRVEQFFFGTVSGKTLEQAHCPVIVVPQSAAFDGIMDHLGVTTHFTPEDTIMVEGMRKFRDQIGAQMLHIIHIDTSSDSSGPAKLEAFCEQWKGDKKITAHCRPDNDVNDGIDNLIQKHNIDILGVLSERRSWFDEIFQKNRAKELVHHISTPIMVFQKEHLLNSKNHG